MRILGISGYYHDSAAALLVDGNLVAAAQEERFTRKRHDADFPAQAVNYCLSLANLSLHELDYVVFYDKPLLKFDRLLETYFAFAPKGFRSFVAAMPVWLKEKLFLKSILKQELEKLAPEGGLPKLLFTEHHQSHAASAYFPSPYDDAAVLCMDGVGEWATTSVWKGAGNQLEPVWEIGFPHSIGLLYSAFTYYTGFKVNSGEYKVMGLAPYGEPRYVDLIRDHLVDIKPDGTFRLNMDYFNYTVGLTMTNAKFDELFGAPARLPESEVTQREMDLARSIQTVVEDVVIALARTVRSEQGSPNLCLAGGVALNCVANGRLAREGIFENIWVQPAAGDAGGAIGAAYSAWHQYLDKPRFTSDGDSMSGSYLGPGYNTSEVEQVLAELGAPYERLDDAALALTLAGLLNEGNVVGWFQGRMEFGPRALGSRSIIGDPRNRDMQTTMNLKIKYRESFRPFAPSVMREHVADWFELDGDSPYMLMVAPVKTEHRLEVDESEAALFGIDKLKRPRSTIPAVTHVDYSARIQTVDADTNPRYHQLLKRFYERTGCPMLVNTSFNVRGEPIVCTPRDAYRCFMRTNMDYLVLENCLLKKSEQQPLEDDVNWRHEFELD